MSSRKCPIEQIKSSAWRQQTLRLAGPALVSLPNIFILKVCECRPSDSPSVRPSVCPTVRRTN